MTDPYDLDELASAHLDGATSPEEAALVAADPALQARVEELRAVRATLGEVPAVDLARREAAITAALTAFDEEDAPESALAPVTALAPAPKRVAVDHPAALGAAAVIAILALLVPLLAGIDTSDDDEAATFDATGDALGGGEGPAEAPASSGAESATEDSGTDGAATAGSPAADLGAYEDLDALIAAVGANEALRSAAGETAFDAGTDVECTVPFDRIERAVALVAEEPVEVYVRTDADGTRTLTVLAGATCDVIIERQL